MVLLGGAWWALTDEPEATAAATARTAPAPRRLVVGPLVAVGGDAQAAAFIQGLTSELETVLVAVPGLRVATADARARDSASAATPVPIASESRLRLEGTVQREGTQVRVLLRAMDLGRGTAVWSGSFDGRADSLLALQGRVARSVANGLAVLVERDTVRR